MKGVKIMFKNCYNFATGEPMRKIKVEDMKIGDIITGTEASDDEYIKTNSKVTMRVVDVFEDEYIMVEIISAYHHGECYKVESKYFRRLGVQLK